MLTAPGEGNGENTNLVHGHFPARQNTCFRFGIKNSSSYSLPKLVPEKTFFMWGMSTIWINLEGTLGFFKLDSVYRMCLT